MILTRQNPPEPEPQEKPLDLWVSGMTGGDVEEEADFLEEEIDDYEDDEFEAEENEDSGNAATHSVPSPPLERSPGNSRPGGPLIIHSRAESRFCAQGQ